MVVYLADCKTVLQGAARLLPAVDKTSPSHAELWSIGASPLVSYCKALSFIFESNKLLDQFLQSLEVMNVSAGADEALPTLVAGGLDEWMCEVFGGQIRSGLRAKLRAGLEPLTMESQVGMGIAMTLMGARLDAILGADEAEVVYAAPDVRIGRTNSSGRSGAWLSQGMDEDPSMPFVNASAFLEQQLSGVRSTLTGANRESIVRLMAATAYKSVLSRWLTLKAVVTVTGGLQMATDGRAIAQVFGGVCPESGVDRLGFFGNIFVSRAVELARVVEAEPLARADASAIIALLEKRVDTDDLNIQNLRTTLRAAINVDEASTRCLDL
jgi:hypothetical protein